MNELESLYCKWNIAAIVAAKYKLATIKMANYGLAEEYCDAITLIVNELIGLDEEISDEEVFLWMVEGLPSSMALTQATAMSNLHLNGATSGIPDLIITEAANLPPKSTQGTPHAALTATSKGRTLVHHEYY